MIDFHNHIIPNLDDGSKSVEMSLNMLKEAQSQGITDIINTVHFQHPKMDNKNTEYNFVISEIKKMEEIAKSNHININIHAASEVFFQFNLTEILDNKITTFGNGKYMLIEFQRLHFPQGYEDELFKLWELQVGKKIILFPGRLTSWKGQEIFLESINKVNIQLGHDAFIAVLLGSDQGRDLYKKKLIRLVEQYRLTNQVKFIEHCKNMPVAYKISNFVVSASIKPEAFGRVSVEAQSMQKPILASNIGGSKETIVDNKTGILFEAGNSDDMSKKIIELLNLEESTLNQMGIEGRKNTINKFNVEKMCFSTYSEYKKLFN